MGVAFALEVSPSRNEARLDACAWVVAALGLALTAAQLAAGPVLPLGGDHDGAWRAALSMAAAVGAACATGSALRRLRRPSVAVAPGPRLSVDDAGALALQAPGGPLRPMALRASCALPGLTLLIVAPYPLQARESRRERPVALRIGRDAVPADDWRRLHVWLRWIERGPTGP